MEDYKIVTNEDTTTYWLNGKIHRVGGPAVIKEKSRAWYIEGKLHRTEGPAYFGTYGGSLWFIHGTLLLSILEELAIKINNSPEIAPLYINDPILKYVAFDVLKRTETWQ